MQLTFFLTLSLLFLPRFANYRKQQQNRLLTEGAGGFSAHSSHIEGTYLHALGKPLCKYSKYHTSSVCIPCILEKIKMSTHFFFDSVLILALMFSKWAYCLVVSKIIKNENILYKDISRNQKLY